MTLGRQGAGMRRAWFILAVLVLLHLAWVTRYSVVPLAGSPLAVRLDQWTGAVSIVSPSGVRGVSLLGES